MPNRAIEIHDSILEDVSFSQGEARLYLSLVYIHQSEGVPGSDAGSVWVQKAILRIRGAKVKGMFSEFPVDLSGAERQCGKDKKLCLSQAAVRNWNFSVSPNTWRSFARNAGDRSQQPLD